jgi:uncharacterized integral membrane protein
VRLLHWLVTLPAAVIAVIFAVANREAVSVSLWPLAPHDVPLYLVVLLALLAGFLIGEFVAWVNGGETRRLARERVRRIAALERELAATQAMATPVQAAMAKAAPPAAAPVRALITAAPGGSERN